MNALAESLLRQSPLFLTTLACLAFMTIAYALVSWGKAGDRVHLLGSLLSWTALGLCSALIAQRWIEAGRPPFKSLYESLVLFAWCTSILHLVVERFYRIAWFGFLSGAFLVLVLLYAVLKSDADIVNLPAALQSVWFVPHVVVYFFGYAGVFFAFAAALLHLRSPETQLRLRIAHGGTATVTYAGFMHKTILFAFVLLTTGLVMGSVWAKSAWGDYWVWDPKENWALVSWLVFVIYLHLRSTKGFSERQGAILTVAGFLAIAFTYLGMHLLPTADASAHIYQ